MNEAIFLRKLDISRFPTFPAVSDITWKENPLEEVKKEVARTASEYDSRKRMVKGPVFEVTSSQLQLAER